MWDPRDYGHLETIKSFDPGNDQFGWEFKIRVNLFYGQWYTTIAEYQLRYSGEICVVTKDNVSHLISTWKRSSGQNEYDHSYNTVSCTQTDKTWGEVQVSNIYGTYDGFVTIDYTPSPKAFKEGVKQIVMTHDLESAWEIFNHHTIPAKATVRYEKDLSGIAVDKPMPKPTVGWGTDGKLAFKAAGMPDKRNNKLWDNEYYSLNAYYNKDGNKTGSANYGTNSSTVSYANEKDGKMDMSFGYWPADGGAYTMPVYVNTQGHIQVKPNGTDAVTYDQPEAESVLVEPYTRPKKVWVDYDQWNMKATINWSRQEKAAGYDGNSEDSVKCRTDGRWYVVRYEATQGVGNYETVKDISGDATSLQVVDDKIDYDKKYTYRVIFLPDILKSAYQDRLASLPGQSASHSTYDLWEQAELQTTFSAPVTLSHDKSDTLQIHLTWEYNIPLDGLKWSVESRKAGSNDSWTEEQQLSLEPKKHTEEVRLAGSPCNPKEYRVRAMINNRQVCSDILGASLPSGTFISDLSVTTGTEEQKVVLQWKVERPDTEHDIYYRVLRRIVGDSTWVTLNSSIHGTFSEYDYTDDRALAGTYYEYAVQAFGALCDEQLKQSDMIVKPGFSQACGTITGHIAFGSGTAVQGVRVNLVRASADQEGEQAQYLSRYIDGDGKGLLWQGDSATYAGLLNGKQPLTLQLWAKPSGDGSSQMSLATLNGALQIGVKRVEAGYCLFAADLSGGNAANSAVKEFPALTFSQYDFTHVTAVYDGRRQWKFYVGTDTLLTDSITVANSNWKAIPAAGTNTLAIGGSHQAVTGSYKGHVDDIRLWTRALKAAEVESNYTRILGGTEEGLRLYWPLDEGERVRQYAFDIACQDGIYQQNHPEVGANTVPRKEVPQRLKLYGMTDSKGNYIIKGIPFQRGGTNYEVVPMMGIHTFSPATRSMFISPTSLTANNIDFEDVSSFPMKGKVHYVDTNIPVEGAVLYVDGQPQSKDGKLIQTNDEGYYEVSVPIGEHFVEVRLDDHKMVAGGRFPLTGRYNFVGAVNYNFQDSTLVNFVGRVAGGERSDTLGVGFGQNERIVGGPSKNNIGVATITLKINNESKSFNCKTGTTETHQQNRTWASDTVSVNSHTHTGFRNGEDHYIFIHTDSVTGEFSALLPPLKYTVKSITVESNRYAIEFTELPEINMTTAKELLSDSVRMVKENSADTVWVKYSYTAKMVKTYFAPPQLDVVEKGHEPGYYGLEEITYPAQEEGQQGVVIKGLYSTGKDGKPEYMLNYPVYQMGGVQYYVLKAYEMYENHDEKEVRYYPVALNGQEVIIANEMSDVQKVVARVDDEESGYKVGDVYELVNQRLTLDKNGEGELKWNAGPPNIVAPYTRKFSVIMNRRDRTYNVANIDAIVLGQLITGNNFVTKGPDKVLYVLRDPYGANSKTTLKKGTITTRTKNRVSHAYGDHSVDFNLIIGTELVTAKGVGCMLVSQSTQYADVDLGTHATWEKTWSNDSTWVTTTINDISTSDKYPYVGANGDVFVGNSMNLLIGSSRYLHIKKNPETDKYEVVLDDALSFADEIKTTFYYTTYELRTVMIPKWKDMRRQFMDSGVRVNTKSEAESYVNNGKHATYVTWLKPDEENYATDGTYIYKEPQTRPAKSEIDSIQWCNEQIRNWELVMYNNEKEKVLAQKNQTPENISLDGGSSFTFTDSYSDAGARDTTSTWKLGFVVGFDVGVKAESILRVGCIISGNSEQGGGETSVDGLKTENTTEWEYTFSDGNRDVDISINQYASDDWMTKSKIFTLFGGQTYNPYEPADTTYYYEPGTVLGNGTEQMERPDMRIGLPGENPSTSVTVTNIPAGGEANVVLQCTNLGNAHQGVMFNYGLEVLDETNKNGLQILMDGVPINGRSLYLEHGESVTKVLTIRQTDQSILDYEGIKLWFESQYQPNSIHSEVTLNAHFVPSSSPVMLAIDEPVVNSNTPGGELQMRLKGFNRQFKNLRNVGVQYRFQGSTQWTDLHTWWVNPNDTIGRDSLSHKLLPKTGDLRLALDMTSDLAYPEGNYEFRAFTTTPYGTDMVHVYSDVAAVIKDRKRPINLYTPAPANGILGYGDQMAIEFNEDIVPGYVGGDNVVVTAKLNSSEVHHDVSYQLVPFEEMMPRTVNPVFLTSSFAMDFWLNWHEAGTILHLGKDTDNFALSIGDDGYVTVTMGNNTYRSKAAVPKDSWTFFALNYDTDKKVFNMLALQGTDNIYLFTDEPVSMENVQAVHYLSDNRLYLGPVEADIHSLGLYNYCRDLSIANEEKYNAKDGYVYGLANFWPMDEGHGTVAGDLRHTHDFVVKDMWKLENKNYGLMINKPEGIMADITRIGTGDGESYAIEMWYNKSGNPKGETVFETATPDPYSPMTNLNKVTNLHLRFDSLQNLVLDYGGKSQVVASHEAFPDLRRYHHYALNVVRGQAASFYLDGQRTAVIPEADVPPMQGTSLVVGRNNQSLALVDEIRIWHAALSESRLLSNMYNTLDTADVYSRGLAAYYPFEKTGKENGVTTKVIALENMAPKAAAMVLPADTASLVALTPPLKNAPDETVLTATPVASDRKVVINLSMVGLTARQLEGTTLNITVDKVRDLHGNESQPIRWTAYVQQNTLKWTRDSVNVIKKYGEDYTFDVDIENKSGNTEYYTLYNMPQWLSLVNSERSDDVSPLRTKTLRFRVNPLTPVGNYDATIGLQGNNGILEPMRIVMKVRGERPQWAVDPTKYEHQMSIVGQVYINGILMENAESMVAAFIGDECRGVASPERVRGAAYVTMTVYGKDTRTADMGKTLSFRIWDATQGVAYTDAQIAVDGSPIDIVFRQDKLIGNFDHPAIWTKSENVEQLIPVHLNWNWIAFGVVPKSPYLDHIFADYADWQLLIKDRTRFSDYNGAEWNGTLQPVANAMYKLRIDRLPTTKKEAPNSLLAVSGRQLKEDAERAVTLSKGWNWIAYTPLTTMTVDEALAAANPQTGDIVKSQTGVAIYGPYGWEGSLKALEGGHGYLYFTNDSTGKSFLYPAASSASAKARMAAPRRAAEEDELRIFHPVELGLYPSNMTMVIRLLAADGSPVDTCEVGAFIGDECRGAARASSRGLYYLVISGEGAGQPMTLRSCIDGQIIDIDTSLMYVSDDNIGTSWEPYVIDLSRILTGIIAVDGSPTDDDSDWYTLQGFNIGRKPTQPGVYIHRGEKVMIKRAK